MSHPLGRHQPTPGDIACVAGQFLPEKLPAHRRVDAVGADQYVARELCAVRQPDGDLVRGLRESLDARIEPEAFISDPTEQNVEQIGAVGVIVRRAELCLRTCAQRGIIEAVAIIPGAIVTSLHADARQGLVESERAQDAGGVGAELDAGADLAERFGLLEKLSIDAASPHRQEGREATDAAAGDKHLEIVGSEHSCASQPREPDEHKI